jgi:hypothetical protein
VSRVLRESAKSISSPWTAFLLVVDNMGELATQDLAHEEIMPGVAGEEGLELRLHVVSISRASRWHASTRCLHPRRPAAAGRSPWRHQRRTRGRAPRLILFGTVVCEDSLVWFGGNDTFSLV